MNAYATLSTLINKNLHVLIIKDIVTISFSNDSLLVQNIAKLILALGNAIKYVTLCVSKGLRKNLATNYFRYSNKFFVKMRFVLD